MKRFKQLILLIFFLPRTLWRLLTWRETRVWAWGFLGLLFGIFLVWLFLENPKIDYSLSDLKNFVGLKENPGQKSLEKNPVQFNEEEFRIPGIINPKGLNLVFFADQYASWSEFEKDIEILMGEIKMIEPWQSYSAFNIFKINPKTNGLCWIKIKDERKPVLRCGEEINNYLGVFSFERFRLIVLSRQEFQSWANMTRLQNSGIFFSLPQSPADSAAKKTNGLLLAHLFGHVFGLKDEEIFVLAKAGGAPHTADGPNCAPDAATAENWWGGLTKQFPQVGYFKGCGGDENLIKPTQSSIMNLNTGAEMSFSYGPVSEQYLKKILDYCFNTEGFSSAKSDKAFFEQYPEFKECLKS